MKTHRLILFFSFSLVFFLQQVFSADFPGSKTVVAYVQPNQGNPYYAYGTFGIDIGYKYVSEAGASEKARTKFTFDLTTIPGNADIISVQLSYYAYNYANSSYKFKLTQIGNYNSPQEIWQNIGQAASLFTDVAYASGSLNNGTLTSMVNSSKGSYLYIGALSQNENNSDSRANLDLTLNVQYSVPPASVNITADNNFTALGGTNHGTMVIDGTNRTIPLTGYTFQKTVGQNLTLSANSPQDDNQGFQRIWHTGSTNRSIWDRNGVFKSNDQTYSFTVASDDNNKTYMANLRKNYAISRNHQTEFNGNIPAGIVTYIVEQNSGQISAPTTFTPGSITYNYAGWDDNLSESNPRTIWPTNNETYTALYKYPHHSNSTLAYENPNQRRFVKSSAGYFHMVYESMGKIWYERKFGESGTWEIMNGGKPINDGYGQYPSIDYLPDYYGGDMVVIVYLEDSDSYPAGLKIIAKYFDNSAQRILEGTVASFNEGIVGAQSIPVVSFSQGSLGSFMLVAWNYGNIYYRLGRPGYTNNDIDWDTPPTEMNWGHFIERRNPTIASPKGSTLNSYWIAMDDNNTKIQFLNLNVNHNQSGYYVTEVYGAAFYQGGFQQNYQPSISVMPNNDYRVSWFGENTLDGIGQKQVVTWFNYQFYIFGTSPSSHSMSVTDDGKSIITYGDQNGTRNKFRQVWYYTLDKNLGTTGKQTHLSNGSSLNDMYAMSFQNATLPYSFTMSANLGSLQKVTETNFASGRRGIVAGDSAEFYFTLGDVTLNGNTIDFIPTGLNPDFTNLDTLNYYLSTEKFNVTNSSQFDFSIQYGVTDSLKAVQSLTENEYVKFKLQLINANNNNLIGEYTVVTFTKQNIIPSYGESFSINTNGIGNKKVKVRIVVEENISGEYAMANISAEENVLPKQNPNIISYTGSEVVTEYALEQNYPNPFNPKTTIKYQIPTSGNVTIKVYDILGNEVAKLIDGYMETGKYEVSFDAWSLASGVYIYQLRVNDFISSKKMILMK